MKKCLFDANAISLILNNNTPKKWSDAWRDVRMGLRGIIYIEPLISEVFYKNIPKFKISQMKKEIIGLKSYRQVEILQLDDNDAIAAGELKYRHGLSLVDCFILSVARRYRAKIFTTDRGIRDVGRIIKVDVDFIPLRK